MTQLITRFIVALCLVGGLVGLSPSSAADDSRPPSKVDAKVTSNPPGVRVTYTAFGKSRVIGTTPFSWSVPLADLTRSSMIPILTFELDGYQTHTETLSDAKKVHVVLKPNKAKSK